MCFYDLEPAEFFKRTTPKARKQHRCSERGCVIAKGETYESVRAKWDGEMTSLKVCANCQAIKAAIVKREIAQGCSRSEAHPGYGEGNLREVLANYDDEERAEILAAAAPKETP